MVDRRPTAEKLRRHAIVFQLAQSLNITPREAEIDLDRREARARWQATEIRLAAKKAEPATPNSRPHACPTYWWNK